MKYHVSICNTFILRIIHFCTNAQFFILFLIIIMHFYLSYVIIFKTIS